ncbi:MAG: translation elongation factor Ts [bacterium]
MEITAQLVKDLREKTGAGMMDCKKALVESDGDFEKAIEILRKKGAAVAAKRAERSANEGIILTTVFNNNESGIILEVNCETDFVAKSDDFVAFANFALEVIKANKPADVAALLDLTVDGKKVQDTLTDLIGKIGEKIEVKRFAIESAANGMLVDYIHHGSKLGVVIKVENVPAEGKEELGGILKDVAMQVAAMKPSYVYRENVPADIIEKEKDIYKELAKKEGKPANILDKIADGRLVKFYEENCLVEQAFVKDNTKKIGELISEFNKKNGAQSKIVLFHRFHLSDENK